MTAASLRRNQKHPSYYVVMIDYGRRGRQAVSDPEWTRSEIVHRIKTGQYENILFIHYIDDEMCDDVTSELIDEAEAQLKQERFIEIDRLAARWDHQRDLRKHT